MDVNGFLAVDKPSGCTSHDVVAQIRRHFGVKKVGHTGTLDPMATGVLILGVGAFTRLSDFLSDQDKRYRAAVCLGIETDTLDAEGVMVKESANVPVDLAPIRAVLRKFTGEINQIPPMFSAIKQGGKKLYELARKGQHVPRNPRRVQIHAIELLDFCSPILHLDIHCSKGTYIRSLAADIGTQLGCGAHLASLQRTSVGPISVDLCASLDSVLRLSSASDLVSLFVDPDLALADVPKLTLDALQTQRFLHGNTVADLSVEEDFPVDGPARVYDTRMGLLGIGRWCADLTLQPVRVISRRES